MNAKVGFALSPNRRKTSCPNFPMASACSRFSSMDRADKSAPAAKINGFPVIAIADAELACAAVIASFNFSSEVAPNVFGRV